jgi:rsbT co-antagonist protein RsbR
LLKIHESALLENWLKKLEAVGGRVNEVVGATDLKRYSTRIVAGLVKALESGNYQDVGSRTFDPLREALGEISANFAEMALTPSETASYVFSLKEVLFELCRQQYSGEELMRYSWEIGQLVDALGLFTFEAFTAARERLIKSQAQSLAELSTPVIKVWDGIIALPLVGSVDSIRAKEIMEKLLDAVIAYNADIVIIDITGVPVVDTQVANRLMRTVEAVRLLGTKSIITGINPIVAQTLVQLGVDISQLTTKASLQAGLQQAFRELRFKVTRSESAY